jgi:ABC-2 type transport system ATP-binding protein
MRGRDVIELFSGLQAHGSASRSLEIAKRLELDLSRRVMFMSTGMRQKLAIAVVLGSQAPVIVLDEPTANLDPTVRSEVVALVREAHDENRTIVLSSHIFSDIEETCDAVAILKQGSVVGHAHLSELQRLHIVRGRAAVGVTFADSPIVKHSFVEFVRQEGREVQLQLSGLPQAWLNWLADSGLDEMRIENAGVRAFYERFHAPKLAADATNSE